MNNGFREPPLRHSGDFFILSYEYSTPKAKHTHNMLKKTFNVYKNKNQPTPHPLHKREDVREGEGPTPWNKALESYPNVKMDIHRWCPQIEHP